MRVLAGSLSATDREILIASNREGRRVCVHARQAEVVEDQRGEVGPRKSGCYVGVVQAWDRENAYLAGWTFRTRIPWESITAVWWRDEAPDPCPHCEVGEEGR